MCLSILEIAFLVVGIWLLISGKVPTSVFQFMFGKGNYVMQPTQARLFGLLLASPLPVVVVVSVAFQLVLVQNQTLWSGGFEAFYDVAIALTALYIARKIRHPLAATQEAVPANAQEPGGSI